MHGPLFLMFLTVALLCMSESKPRVFNYPLYSRRGIRWHAANATTYCWLHFLKGEEFHPKIKFCFSPSPDSVVRV